MAKFNIENRRYTGSKTKLSEWIIELIKDNCKGRSFLDIFAGTGIISAKAVKYFDKVIINDFLYSNFVVYNAFFGKENWDSQKLDKIVAAYNNLDYKNISENYFSVNFGGKYFSQDNAKIIGHIREDIEKQKKKLLPKEYYILLAALIYSTDRVANTVGHYDAYIRKKPPNKKFVMELINPIKSNTKIYEQDANKLAKEISADIVYIDPPYNSRQYSRFYHVLENLTKWKKPKLYGVALKPEPEDMSDYCKTNAANVFNSLIKNLNCKYIVVSYNNTYNSKSNSSKNKIELNTIKEILNKKGETKVFKKAHPFFNAGKTDFKEHTEFIFITEVK